MNHLARFPRAAVAAPLILLTAFASAAVFSPKAAAASAGSTITVNSTSDAANNDGLCTLREAITAANNDAASGGASGECAAGAGDDTIAFSVTGTINLTGALPDINSNMTIAGPGSSQLTVRRDTGGNYRIFFNNNRAVSISGMIIENGRTPDGAPATNGALFGNDGAAGGGIYNGGVLTLTDVLVTSI
jgi:CSLREA domain-containing protein